MSEVHLYTPNPGTRPSYDVSAHDDLQKSPRKSMDRSAKLAVWTLNPNPQTQTRKSAVRDAAQEVKPPGRGVHIRHLRTRNPTSNPESDTQ
jgi:hypothetical protein